MLRLKSLKFSGIGRFIEPQEINFNNLGNLIQIDGNNLVTGGSSGAGKSTIFHALDFLFGINDQSISVLQSRLIKDHVSVEGHLDWDGKDVIIKRNRKLSITVDGIETSGSSKISEEFLDTIIGMPRNLFHELLHRQQGKSGFFLGMNPSQMNTFLTDCLNLAPIRSKIDTIDVKLKELVHAKTESQNSLQASQAALDATVAAKASLGQEPIPTVTEVVVEGWKAQLKDAEAVLEALLGSNRIERAAHQATKPKLVTTPYDHAQIESLEVQIKSLEAQIEQELDKERSRQINVNNVISAIKSENAGKIAAIKLDHGNKIAESKTTVANLTNLIFTGGKAKEVAIQLAAKIKSVRDGLCHTCLQSWQTDQNKAEEQRLLKELSECKIDIEASIFATKELTELKSALVVLNDRVNAEVAAINEQTKLATSDLVEQAKPQVSAVLTQLKTSCIDLAKQKTAEFVKEDMHKIEENARNQNILEAFFLEVNVLADKHRISTESVAKEVNEYKSQYERSAQALASHLIALNRYQTALDSLKSKESDINSKVVDFNQKVVDLSEKIEIAEEAKRCLKSYLSCSFEDALDSVSESATKILRSVPTMANASIRLQGTKELGSGAIKETVNALLDNDGELEIPIKSLSGGERSAVDLAIDLAVCEMIQEKANKGIDIMVLDEPFGGFDSIGVEHALEMLKTLDKRILIVEHNPVAKEFIDCRITVVRDGETSYIK
jgi:hypothetical protein